MVTKLMAPLGKGVAKFHCGGSEGGENVVREFRTAMSVYVSVCQCLSYTSTSLSTRASTRAKLCTTLSITKVSTVSKMLRLVHSHGLGRDTFVVQMMNTL